tara:strand:- start:24 stop:329 length:306 start_codon:yes stop_codon:yes gene_type:complete
MAIQNNFYRVNSSENLTAGTATGTTRSGACPTGVLLARISTSALVYVEIKGGQGATPTATVAGSTQIGVSDSAIFTVVPGDTIAAITSAGAATVNISWLDG